MLFTEAEARKKRIEHVLDPRPTCEPIKGISRGPQILSNDDNVRGACGLIQSIRCILNVPGLTSIERDRILRGQDAL